MASCLIHQCCFAFTNDYTLSHKFSCPLSCFFSFLFPLLFLYSYLLLLLWISPGSIRSHHCAARAEVAFWPVSTLTTTRWETTPCPGTARAPSGRKAQSPWPSLYTSANRNTRHSSLGNTLIRLEHTLQKQSSLWVWGFFVKSHIHGYTSCFWLVCINTGGSTFNTTLLHAEMKSQHWSNHNCMWYFISCKQCVASYFTCPHFSKC